MSGPSKIERWSMLKLLSAICLALAACGYQKTEPMVTLGAMPEAAQILSADIAIVGAQIVDGTGAAPFDGDVLVKDGAIVHICKPGVCVFEAERVIEAAGRTLAPGFIDLHAHGDPAREDFQAFLAMGVTTIALGQDGRTAGVHWRDGFKRPRPLSQWIAAAEAAGVQLNVAPLSGHGTIRVQTRVYNTPGEALTAENKAAMRAQLEKDMQAGAFGLSTGLEYIPGIYSTTEELVSLAEIVGAHDGVVMSHMRTEDDDVIEGAIDELAAQGAHARVHISHLKVVYGKGAERAERLLAHIEQKRAEGVPLTADIYPYTAGYAGLALIFPDWANAAEDYEALVAAQRKELAVYLHTRVTKRNGPGAILLTTEPYTNKTLEEAAAEAGVPFVDFLIDVGPEGAEAAHFTQDASTHDALVASPLTTISTDGGPVVPHPRSTATYAKLFRYYVNETSMLSLEEAVRKASGYPASILGFTDRGLIREGFAADLVVFRPDAVTSAATYANPWPVAEGFDVTIVNGKIARENGVLSSERHGAVLRRFDD